MVGNGAASDFMEASTSVYTALITPAADGLVTVDVAKEVATDLAGNDNPAATQATSTYTALVTNSPPTVANAIPDRAATADTSFSYAFPANTFTDADDDPLTYTATQRDDTALPPWLTFAAATRTFSGTPQAGDVGTLTVKVTASDDAGATASDEFDIEVSGVPVTAAAIIDGAFTSLPSDGEYNPGDTIEVTFTFDANVTVLGTPSIEVAVGAYGTATLQYVADASTRTTVVLRATVIGADHDDTDALRTSTSLDVGTGAIHNEGRSDVVADIAHATVSTATPLRTRLIRNIAVTSQPFIPPVFTRGQKIRGIGEALDFTVEFADTVSIAGQAPVLHVKYGTQTYEAGYESGSGSSQLRFRWVTPETLEEGKMQPAIEANIGPDASRQGVEATLTDSQGNTVNDRYGAFTTDVYIDVSKPTLLSTPDGATVNGSRVDLVYRDAQDPTRPDSLHGLFVPGPGDYTLTAGERNIAVSRIKVVDADRVELLLAEPVREGETVTLDYTAQGSRTNYRNHIVDQWQNTADPFTGRNVRNDTIDGGNSFLATLSIPGFTFEPAFHPAENRYWVTSRPSGSAPFTVTAATQDPDATIEYYGYDYRRVHDLDLGTGGHQFVRRDYDQRTMIIRVVAANGDAERSMEYRLLLYYQGASGRQARVNSVTFGAPNKARAYRPGEEVDIDVEFDEPVHVDGSPRLRMETGSGGQRRSEGDEHATYHSSPTPEMVTFRYVIPDTMTDVDALIVPENALDTNDGMIENWTGNMEADVTHGRSEGPPVRMSDVEGIEIVSTPRVPGDLAHGTSAYGAGERVVFAVNLARDATVTFADPEGQTGAPALTLEVGGNRYQADYSAGTGSQTLRLEWTVPAGLGPNTTDITVTANTGHASGGLTLEGSTLTDAHGLALDIEHPAVVFENVIRAAPPVRAAGAESVSVDATALMVRYVSSTDEAQAAVLNPAAIPDPGDFAVEADGEPVTVNAVELAADQGLVRLTLASAVRAGQSVTLTYTPGETPIADVWGNSAGAFTNIPVHNATSSSEALSNDATLRTFRLADIAFDTPFTAQRTQYSAEVEHGTGEVKIVARPTQADATVEYLDGAGEPIADAGPGAAGMQAALEVGENVIGVRVTAPDGTTTRLYEATVERAQWEQTDEPLVVELASGIEEHDGLVPFRVAMTFSEPVTLERANVRSGQIFNIANGRVVEAVRVHPNDSTRWHVMVTPGATQDTPLPSQAPIDISLKTPTGECAGAHAVCTPDGRTFEAPGPSVRIEAPVTVTIADATTHEAPGATLDFEVTLSGEAHRRVRIRYATSNGTAAAGEDYTHTEGRFEMPPGTTRYVVSVPVLDDAIDEGEETMSLAMLEVEGALPGNHRGVGTIVNTDAMPQAWLARFGRTVAEQVLDAVEGRLEASRRAGFEARLAGQRLGGEAPDADALEEAQAKARLEALSGWLRGEACRDDPGAGGDCAAGTRTQSREVTGRDVLTGSSFALTGASEESGFATLWARGALSRFDGRVADAGGGGDLTLDGEVASVMLGVDRVYGRGTAGMVIAHSRGAGEYRAPGGDGEVSSTVTGLYPFGRYRVNERTALWGVAGYGAGELVLTPDDGEPLETGMDLMMAAAGLRGTVVEAPPEGGPGLAVKTDALAVRTSSEAVGDGAGGNLAAATADVTRLRLGLEGTWKGLAPGGGRLTASVELGVRHDGGDAETGFGLDVGAGLAWSDPERGIEAELRGRGLLTHEDPDFRERGLSGSLGWDPDPGSDLGSSLTLRHTVGGRASGGMDALLGRDTMAGLAANDNGALRRRLEATFGYGIRVLGGRFIGTPQIGLGLSDSGRELKLGWRLGLARRAGNLSFDLNLKATRRESANDDRAPEHGVGLRLGVRW